MNAPEIERVINLAKEKQNLMEDFLKLTEDQAESINNHNYESILDTINKKQNIIEKINLIDLSCQSNIPADNETLQCIGKNTSEIMARAIVIDHKNIVSLKHSQALIFEKLKNARQNKVTHALYRGKNIKMEGILLDQKK